MSKNKTYNDEIELNHTTKILRFLDYLSKASPKLYKIAEESYKNKNTISDSSIFFNTIIEIIEKINLISITKIITLTN